VKKELRQHVLGEAMRVFATEDWRGLEQATILLTQLDHRPAAGRLVELLSADRPEVFVTAAWGLRKLAVAETLPAITTYVGDEFARVGTDDELPGRKTISVNLIDHQLSQLNQLLGQERFRPAEPVLHKFVPKRNLVGESRAAAVWALGLIHEGNAIPALVAEMEVRLHDTTGIPPEDPRVRRMIAITFGRMKAADALPSLRKYWHGKPGEEPTENACGWAIERITGEVVPAPEPIRRTPQNWFLRPAG
jgi:HEAT repeat protein